MTPTARTPKTTRSEATVSASSRYQQLRGHLAELKLHAAAEALPTLLDEATTEGLSLTVALERLLAVEVVASAARRLAGRLRFACLPTPATLADIDIEINQRRGSGECAGAAAGLAVACDLRTASDRSVFCRVGVAGHLLAEPLPRCWAGRRTHASQRFNDRVSLVSCVFKASGSRNRWTDWRGEVGGQCAAVRRGR